MVVDWSGPLTADVVAFALAFLVAGVAGHELLHLLAFFCFGRVPRVRFAPKYLGVAFEPRGEPPRWQIAIVSMAPLVWAGAAIWAFVTYATAPINWRFLFIFFAFLIGALPSPGDVYTALMYRPESGVKGVAADG